MTDKDLDVESPPEIEQLPKTTQESSAIADELQLEEMQLRATLQTSHRMSMPREQRLQQLEHSLSAKNGWMTRAICQTGQEVSRFNASWVVPSNPGTEGAIIQLSNSLWSTYESYGIAAMLEWTGSWAVSSYFFGPNNTIIDVSPAIRVQAGLSLTGSLSKVNHHYDIDWLPQMTISDFRTVGPPSMAEFNQFLYMAWVNADDQQMWWSRSDTDGKWDEKKQVSPSFGTRSGPTLAIFNNTLHMMWDGVTNDPAMYTASFNTITNTWGNQTRLNGETDARPTMVVFNNQWYRFWKGKSDSRIWYSIYQSDSTWTPQTQPDSGSPFYNTDYPPTAAVFQGSLFLAWVTTYNYKIMWSRSNDGANWPSPRVAGKGIATRTGVSLIAFGDSLYMVWASNAGTIWWSKWTDPEWNKPEKIVGIGVSSYPLLATFQSVLYMTWQGPGYDKRICCSTMGGIAYEVQFLGFFSTIVMSPLKLTTVMEGLGVRNFTDCSQYPREIKIGMSSDITFSSTPPPFVWKADFPTGDCGEHTVIVSNSLTNGQVNLYLTVQQRFPWQGTVGPALASFSNLLFMAWASPQISLSSYNGSSWSQPQNVDPSKPTSSYGPALASCGDFLYIAWVTNANPPQLAWSRYNGNSWNGINLIGAQISYSPALTSSNGQMYMAWRTQDHDYIFVSEWNGTGWNTPALIPGIGTSFGPSLGFLGVANSSPAGSGGDLYMAWKGSPEGDHGIYWSYMSPGSGFVPQKNMGPENSTSQGPAITQFKGAMFMAWNGTSQEIYWSVLRGTWSTKTAIRGVATSARPALALWNGLLYMAWKGMNKDTGLYWSAYDGNSWEPM